MPPDPSPPVTEAAAGHPSWIAPVTPVIPDHELVRRIGGGSYGDVWLARNAVGTWRAVKVVFRDRFLDARPYEREFSGMQKFEPLSRSNEAFVDILQIGRNDADGYFYYVMELADDAGPSLGGTSSTSPHLSSLVRDQPSDDPESGTRGARPSEARPSEARPAEATPHFDPSAYIPRTLSKVLLQRGRLPVDECLELGITLNLGLAHLHAAGLIHRDIKPSNIIYVGGVPKLADIGLVIEVAEARSFVGTEGFIPPEGPNSPQSDIYSLGKVLYEAGMGKDRKDFPEPYSLLAEAPDAPQLLEFNSILLKACAANREERYRSAEEMNADLALLQSGGSVRQQRKLAGQLRFVQRAGALVTALAAVIALGWWWQARQTQKVRQLAEEKSQVAAEKTALADELARINEEDRNRIVRLDIASGMRLLEEGDPAGALLWFADALPLLTNNPAQESIHRIRIQQTLDRTPRVQRVFPHESGLTVTAYSPDGRFIATATKDGNTRVWNAEDGTLKWGPKRLPTPAYFGRFTRDGLRLVLSSSADQGTFNGSLPPIPLAAILDAQTGEEWKWAEGAFEGWGVKLLGAFFSPDDRWLATAHGDGVIRVFDMESGRRTLELRGHTEPVHFLSFSGDGRFLASASLDHTVRLWRLPSGEPVGRPLEHLWPVVRVLLTEDARHVITVAWENVGDDGAVEICVWDTATGERLPLSIGVRDRIALFLTPGPHSALFVQDRAPNLARAYRLETGKEIPLDLKLEGIRSWDLAKDGFRLVLGLGDHLARVVDTRRGAPLTKPFRHGGWGVNTVQFSPRGSELLTGCEDGTVRIWDFRTSPEAVARASVPGGLRPGFTTRGRQEFGRLGSVFPVHAGGGATVVFNDNLQVVHEFRSDQAGTDLFFQSRAPNGGVWAIRVARSSSGIPDALRLAIVKDGKVRQVELPHPDMVGDVAFTPDSRHLISACGDDRIRFWNTSNGSLERTVTVPAGNDGELTMINPDGRIALWRESDPSHNPPQERMRFLDLDSGTFIGEVYELLPTVFDEVFSPTGKYVAFMDRRGPVTILESRTGRLISSAIRHPGTLDWLQWDLEETRLLTAGDHDEVLVWALTGSTHPLRTLKTPGTTTRTARWSPDGRLIVSVGNDHKVRVWDAATGEMVTPPFEHESFIGAAAIIHSNRLITVSYTGAGLRAWDLIETKLSAPLLGDYAKCLSGRRLDATGALLTLLPEELAALNRSLRADHAGLFAMSTAELIQWHRRQVGPTPNLAQLNYALLHLNRLVELAPGDAELKQLLARYEARRVPPRAPETPASLVDLSNFYTSSLDMTPNEEFAELPRGLQTLGGTRWDLRGVGAVEVGEALSRIPVGQRCGRLHFLQFIGGDRGRDGNKVGHWVIRYADGAALEWPLIYGRQVRDWWWNHGQPREASQAEIAWEGHPKIDARGVRLFKATWINPWPDVTIESLDLVGGEVNVTTAVVAITAE